MATAEHLRLSSVIKATHQSLKSESNRIGFEQAWKKHCEDMSLLQTYSKAMRDLATLYWDKNSKANSKAQSRVGWIHKVCVSYFMNGELVRQRERERKIAAKIGVALNLLQYSMFDITKLRLLDVGSCYNPFKCFSNFVVVPIDIAPANDDVFLCDFLKVRICDKCERNTCRNEISALQRNSFDIVVFSLVLEYFPCPAQRLLCCSKAYELLNTEGLLIIVTPDSKHVGANAKLMKSWRYILANIGFSRIKYEKLPHIHCMVFRKSINLEIASRWAQMQEGSKFLDKMMIPQDYNEVKEETEESLDSDVSVSDRIDLFNELPNI